MSRKIVVAGERVYMKFFDMKLFEPKAKEIDAEIVPFRDTDEQKFKAVIAAADALIVLDRPIQEEHFAVMPRCRIVLALSVGYDCIDLSAATERGIIVSNCPSYGREAVAVHALTLLLAVHRKIKLLMEETRHWRWDYNICQPIGQLAGRKLGIIGLGKIGRKLASMVKSLDLEVLAYDPYIAADIFQLVGVRRCFRLQELLGQADFISIHAPLTAETRHLIGGKELKMMKNTAIIVNTARGEIIDERALYRELQAGAIAGAGLDVLGEEPPDKDNPLLDCDKAIVTPHMAWYTEESLRRLRDQGLDEIVRVLQGERPHNIVNTEVLLRLHARS